MTREETVRKLLTELIDMVDNGSQRDFDRADEIGDSIIKLFEQEPILDKIRAEIKGMYRVILKGTSPYDWAVRWNDCLDEVLEIIDKYKSESENT